MAYSIHEDYETQLNEAEGRITELEKELAEVKKVAASINTLPLQNVSQRSEQLAISALKKIAYPVKYLRDKAKKDGTKVDVYMTMMLLKDANFYQDIAEKALKEIDNCG